MLLLTRSIADSIKSKAALTALGFEVFVEPMFEVIYHQAAMTEIHGYDLIIATSRHGVAGLAKVTAARDIPMVTVGDSTRECAIDLGFRSVDTVSGTVSDLLQYLRLNASGARVLYVRGAHVSHDLRSNVAQLGAVLEETVLYSTNVSRGLSAACSRLLVSGSITGVLLYSARTAEIFVELVSRQQQIAHLSRVVAYTISPRAKQILGAFKWKEILVSEHPTEASLFELLQT